jgi:hypothetical protein
MLTLQTPLIRAIIQDAFDGLRASLLFIHAFLDLSLTLSMISEALADAAKAHPRASNIHNRLLADDEYMAKMSRLVRCFGLVSVNAIWLIIFVAPRTYSPFPRGSQGAVCGNRTRVVLLNWSGANCY